MIANSFIYKKVNSPEEAVTLLDGDAKLLAGGHSLLPAMKLRLSNPEVLIDISRIEGLRGIEDLGGSIKIGAATTHAEIANSNEVTAHIPMMSQAANSIGDMQVRNKGTIGGSMAHADPAADWPAVLIASGAEVNVLGVSGSRVINIDDFFTGFFETALEENEIITSIKVPKSASNAHSSYKKFKQPASRFAIVGCAAAVNIINGNVNQIRVAITGACDHAFRVTSVERALQGQALNEDSINNAISGEVTAGQHLLSDHFASDEYRSHLSKVYTKRALMALI